ncbi:MAG TPA: hypothetical protein QF564_00650 [Pirellulaceae bacterium]|nr:hypothetical protein [Pirellulaceae bacterium]
MSSGRKQPTPPPNYFSRRIQLRLLVAVASLLLVVSLMFEARKAENWQWMWSGTQQASPESDEIDTRLQPVESNDPLGTVYANSSSNTTSVIREAAAAERNDARRRLELDAWTKLLARLERSERIELDRVLLFARNLDTQTSDIEPSWSDVLDGITEAYASYLNDANKAVLLSGETLADRQRESLLNALRELEVTWTRELLPALRAPVDLRPWTQLDRDHLSTLQSLLDELALKAIRDDSFWRPAERDAWFRWFEILRQRNPQQLQRESIGQVGFLPLFKQSDDYRGKLVTIRGTARLAYRVQAPRNIHGITGYVVYWVKPAGGPNSPIVVYALETPEGFPEVKDKDLDRATTALNEEVTFTGFFFKRWAYPGQNGLQTAPLILARSPTWTADLSLGQGRPLPGWTVAVGSVATILLLSIAVAVLVYRAGKTPVGEGTSIRKPDRDQLEALKKQTVLASPQETLRRLAAAEREDARE